MEFSAKHYVPATARAGFQRLQDRYRLFCQWDDMITVRAGLLRFPAFHPVRRDQPLAGFPVDLRTLTRV
jgi:hypothetical protein